MHLLIVEDDPIQASFLAAALNADYRVDIAQNGDQALQLYQSELYDVLLVDITLPVIDGIALCKKLRQRGCPLPIILMTASTSHELRLAGLKAGADDYVSKPIQMPELNARLKNLLRRKQVAPDNTLSAAGIEINYDTRYVHYDGTPIVLTPKEYSLLELLMNHKERVMSRRQIIDQLWSHEQDLQEESIKAHIKGLRQKLRQAGAPECIKNVRGIGYRFDDTQPTSTTSPKSAIQRQLHNLRLQYLPLLQHRVNLLRQAIDASDAGSLSEKLRAEARNAAHNIIGGIWSSNDQAVINAARRLEEAFSTSARSTLEELRAQLAIIQNFLQAQTGQPSTAQQTISAPPSRLNATLLALDDDEIFLEILASLLRANGVRVETSTDPARLWELLHTIKPDLLLLDVNMQPHNGIELCQQLRQHPQWKRLPVIFISAHQDSEHINAMFHAMADDYISKPVIEHEIASRIINRLLHICDLRQPPTQ